MAEALSKQDETQQDMPSDSEYDGTENKTVLSYVQAFQWGNVLLYQIQPPQMYRLPSYLETTLCHDFFFFEETPIHK